MTVDQPTTHDYLLLQRSRPYGSWPEDFLYQDDPRECVISEGGSEFRLLLRFGVKTYKKPLTDVAGQPLPVGRLVVDDKYRSTFWMGGTFLHSPDEKTPVQVKFRNAEEGEIDFFIGISCEQQVSMDILQRSLSPLLTTFITAFGIRNDDVIVTTAPVTISEVFDDGTSRISRDISVRVKKRPSLSPEFIVSAFASFFDSINQLSSEDSRRVSVAMRRYQSSMSEADPVDRFCDLWESCEVLGKCLRQGNGKRVGGKIDMVIAYGISTQMGLPKEVVLKKLIQPLYDVRKDLVHNAVEDPSGFNELTNVLEDVTIQLIRLVFRMGDEAAHHINRVLDMKDVRD